MLTLNPVRTREEAKVTPAHRDGPPMLDPSKLTLAPLRVHQPGNYLTPAFDAYDNDSKVRKSTLKARTVLAAAYAAGRFDAVFETFRKGDGEVPYLLIGQDDVVGRAVTDFADLLAQQQATFGPEAKMLMPISRTDGGWRTQPGWAAIRYPEVRDSRLVYGYLRPSIARLESDPEHHEYVLNVRNLKEESLTPLDHLFDRVLP